GKPASDALDATLQTLRLTTRDEVAGMRGQWRAVSSVVLAVWALVWGIGLAWFARLQEDASQVVLAHDVRPRPAAAETVSAAPAAPEPEAIPPVAAATPSPIATCNPIAVADA